MNPCRDCLIKFGKPLCNNLGHCVFEGSNEEPIKKQVKKGVSTLVENLAFKTGWCEFLP